MTALGTRRHYDAYLKEIISDDLLGLAATVVLDAWPATVDQPVAQVVGAERGDRLFGQR